MDEIFFYIVIGFFAQMIDGTLGMAYGVSASSLLLTRGLTPAIVSATVHAAEVFTTGISGISHHFFGNVDRRLFWKLAIPGTIGAAIGAYVLSKLPGDKFMPFVAGYLLIMGVLIVLRVFRIVPPPASKTHIMPLGFFGALLDTIGGGGWGPIVTSTLIARGNSSRLTIGSVNAAEFLVTVAASVVFVFTLGLAHWQIILGLAIGGAIAAPIGAYTCKRIPHRPLMLAVGLLVIGLSLRILITTLLKHL